MDDQIQFDIKKTVVKKVSFFSGYSPRVPCT